MSTPEQFKHLAAKPARRTPINVTILDDDLIRLDSIVKVLQKADPSANRSRVVNNMIIAQLDILEA